MLIPKLISLQGLAVTLVILLAAGNVGATQLQLAGLRHDNAALREEIGTRVKVVEQRDLQRPQELQRLGDTNAALVREPNGIRDTIRVLAAVRPAGTPGRAGTPGAPGVGAPGAPGTPGQPRQPGSGPTRPIIPEADAAKARAQGERTEPRALRAGVAAELRHDRSRTGDRRIAPGPEGCARLDGALRLAGDRSGPSRNAARSGGTAVALRAVAGGVVVGPGTLRQPVDQYGWWASRAVSGWFEWPQKGLRMRFDKDDLLIAIAVFHRKSD